MNKYRKDLIKSFYSGLFLSFYSTVLIFFLAYSIVPIPLEKQLLQNFVSLFIFFTIVSTIYFKRKIFNFPQKEVSEKNTEYIETKEKEMKNDVLVVSYNREPFENKIDELYKKLQESMNPEKITNTINSFTYSELETLFKKEDLLKTNNTPIESEFKYITSKRFYRNLLVKEYVRRRANGICELCGEPAPFKDSQGNPHLENHHIIPLSDNGEDTIDNFVALCPNCHRRLHVLKSEEDVSCLKKKVSLNV